MIHPMSFPARLLNEGEHVVVSTRTHPKALIGPVLVLVVVVAAAVPLGRWVDDVANDDVATVLGIVAGIAAVLLVGWFTLLPLLRWLTTTYTFTNRRFISRSGIVAKEGRTIPLNRISGVDFEIGVVDRIFGCGTLIVSDASAGGQVRVHDIPQVEKSQLLVAEELHRLSSRVDDGA